VTYPDFAEALQARICSDLEAERIPHTPLTDERRSVDITEEHIAALEEWIAEAEALEEQRRHEAESTAKKITELEAHIATLQEATAKAEALSQQQRQEVQVATKRADHLVSELVEITSEFVEMSKRTAELTAIITKMHAELDDYRSRS